MDIFETLKKYGKSKNDAIIEAIKDFNEFKLSGYSCSELPSSANIEVAISALEKQIVKPPDYKVHEKYKALGRNYYCSCGVMFVDFEKNGTNYCGNCGQKLREVHNEL